MAAVGHNGTDAESLRPYADSMWLLVVMFKAGYAGGVTQVGPFVTQSQCETAARAVHKSVDDEFVLSGVATACVESGYK